MPRILLSTSTHFLRERLWISQVLEYISLYMPRFNNSADSLQPYLLTVALHGLRRRYKPSQSEQFIIGAIPTLQEHVFPMAYIILCLRFTLVVRLFAGNN